MLLLPACGPGKSEGPGRVGLTALPAIALGPMERWADHKLRRDHQAEAETLAKLHGQADAAVAFSFCPLESALDFICGHADLNIIANWPVLEAVGITKDTPIELKLKGGSWEDVLLAVLAQAGGKAGLMDYAVCGEVVKVSVRDELAGVKYIEVYDARDLISLLQRRNQADLDWEMKYSSEPSSPHDPALRIALRSTLFPGEPDARWPNPREDAVTELLNLTRTLVIPDTWQPSGDANILEFNGLLAVNQTTHGHRELALLFQQLRGKMAEVEGRPRPRAHGRAAISPAVPPDGGAPPRSRQVGTVGEVVTASPRVEATGGETKTGAAAPPSTQPDANATARFFGVEADKPAQRIAYVVDKSGSMFDTFDYVKVELKRSIGQLGPGQSFAVLFFADDFRPTEAYLLPLNKTGWAPATAENKRQAFEWIDKQTFGSGGNTDPRKAFEKAFSLGGRDNRVQVIYLLTDGIIQPDPQALLKKLDQINTTPAARIHTILFKDRVAEKFMQDIAARHGGKFRFLSEQELGREY